MKELLWDVSYACTDGIVRTITLVGEDEGHAIEEAGYEIWDEELPVGVEPVDPPKIIAVKLAE